MAKVKGLFGTMLRGSIGNVTFRKHDKKNVASQKVSNIKKSSTPGQIYQRAIGNTTMQAYSCLKSICDHSFEGTQYGALSMSHFLHINNLLLRNLGNKARFLRKGLGAKVAPAPFIVAEGTLPPIDVVEDSSKEGRASTWYLADLQSDTLENWKKITPRDFMGRLRLDVGDQLSLVACLDKIGSTSYPDSETWDGSLMRISLTRYVFDETMLDKPMFTTSTDDEIKLMLDEKVLNKQRSVLGTAKLVVNGTGSDLHVEINTWQFNDEACMSVAAIASRKSSSKWLRSNAQLHVDKGALLLQAYMYNDIESSYVLAEDERILNYENPMKKLNASGGGGA